MVYSRKFIVQRFCWIFQRYLFKWFPRIILYIAQTLCYVGITFLPPHIKWEKCVVFIAIWESHVFHKNYCLTYWLHEYQTTLPSISSISLVMPPFSVLVPKMKFVIFAAGTLMKSFVFSVYTYSSCVKSIGSLFGI